MSQEQEYIPRAGSASTSASSSSVHKEGGEEKFKNPKVPSKYYLLRTYKRLGMQPPPELLPHWRRWGFDRPSNYDDPQRKKMKQTVESSDAAENPRNDGKDKGEDKEFELPSNDDDPQRKKMKQTVESSDAAENPRNDGKDKEEDEEVTIFKGILDYYSKNGTLPFSDLIDFHKNSLQDNVSESQLMDRIGVLTEKYIKIEKLDDSQEVSKLLRKIWGHVGAEKNLNVEAVRGEDQDLSMYPYLKETLNLGPELGEAMVKEGLSLLGKSKLKEMDEECRRFKVEQTRFCLTQLEWN
ncbi:hypothetical protein HYC85_014726 [Camellia sinensis]|uniref:Glabrous enhancer-binding protein-like DBD domain-containing protein n=1 Tax=Camellia sinensis TaxID=4442 RepID=A0A7J7H7B3_CAMSI|nr:hypothetical protein HYC85_014726 [Camellia sinensis]